MNTDRPRSPLQAVLFDLDGTLVDTAPDLAHALNSLLAENNRPTLPFDRIRDQVSNGGNALIKLGFDVVPDDPQHPSLRARLLEIYHQCVANQSSLFDGLPNLLEQLISLQIPWGIITNKPRIYTESLLKALNLTPDILVCPEDLGVSKPDPAPLLYAARQLAVDPTQCVYIGDHQRDIEAGRNAGMQTLVAGFGYIPLEENPKDWQPDFIATSVIDLNAWVLQRLN